MIAVVSSKETLLEKKREHPLSLEAHRSVSLPVLSLSCFVSKHKGQCARWKRKEQKLRGNFLNEFPAVNPAIFQYKNLILGGE